MLNLASRNPSARMHNAQSQRLANQTQMQVLMRDMAYPWCNLQDCVGPNFPVTASSTVFRLQWT